MALGWSVTGDTGHAGATSPRGMFVSIGAKELAIRRWAMKTGQTTSERAVLYALAIGDGQMKLGQVRVNAKGYAHSEREFNVRPALASLQRRGQVKQLANSEWRLV